MLEMKNRFIPFTLGLSRLNKMVQKLKQMGMKPFACKGPHTLCIYQLKDQEDGLTPREIAASCDFDPGLVSRTLRELMQQGLVKKKGKEGKYFSRYYLSEEGIRVAVEIEKIVENVQRYVDEGITEEELAVFYRVSDKLEQNFARLLSESAEVFPEYFENETERKKYKNSDREYL